MARGAQREQARAKTQAKLAKANAGNTREGTPLQQNENDKNALQAKLAAKAAAKEQAAKAAAEPVKAPVVRKAKKKVEPGLDDLLNAGLSGTKKKGKK